MVDLDVEDIGPGDLVWLETPLNPYGEARDIEAYARKAHDAGATLLVDATFAPPPLLDPFKWGADMVLHSGSKVHLTDSEHDRRTDHSQHVSL